MSQAWRIPILTEKKSPLISTEIFRMVINLQKTFLQTQSFFTFWNQKQIIFILGGTRSSERKLLKFKSSSKAFTQDTKAISLCNPLQFFFVQSSDTNLIALRGTLGLQCICRAQLIFQTTHLNCRLPCNYVTSLLAYRKG